MKRITMHGASEEEIAQLRDALARSAGALHSKWKIHAGDDTDLLVIDVDTVYGHMDWLRAHSSGRPVAVLTAHTQFSDADLIVHKPLTVDGLVDVLNRADALFRDRPDEIDAPPPAPVARAPVRSAAPAPAAAAPVAAPVPAPPPAPEPPRERRLADWLADGAMRAPVRLRESGAPDLIVDPASKTYSAEGNMRALAPYVGRLIAPNEWQDVPGTEIAQLADAGKMQPLARLLWIAHAVGSNGQLAAGLDLNAKYKLAKWPQIEREFPKHFRIATLMMKQPATLTEIAEQTGATLADVIDFTNAYNAIGFIETDGGARAAEPTQRDSGRGAILSRLRNPFGGG